MADRSTKRKPAPEGAGRITIRKPDSKDEIMRELRALEDTERLEEEMLRRTIDDQFKAIDATVERVRDHQREIGDLRFETRRLLAELRAA